MIFVLYVIQCIYSSLGCPESSYSNRTENISDSWEDRAKGTHCHHLKLRKIVKPGPKEEQQGRDRTLLNMLAICALYDFKSFLGDRGRVGRKIQYNIKHINLHWSPNTIVYWLLCFTCNILISDNNITKERGLNL